MRILVFLILFFYGFTSVSQVVENEKDISVKASLSTDKIAIGDQVLFKIVTVVPAEFKVQFPTLPDSLAKGIEIVRKTVLDSTKLQNNFKQLTFTTLISSFDSGLYKVPSIPVIVNNDTILSDSLLLAVFTLPKDTLVKDIYDVKAPIAEPLSIAEVAPWAGGGLILAALIFLLVMYLKSRKSNKPFKFIQKPVDPPHVIAFRELEKIRQEKLWASENHKYYYTRLIDIVRFYIEGRFSVSAMEQTTDEIITDMKKSGVLAPELLVELNETLVLSDLVKFAKFTPIISENEKCFNFAYDFVERTKQDILEKELIIQDTGEDVNINEPTLKPLEK